MVGTLDRTTPRGKLDAAMMIADWWMAGGAEHRLVVALEHRVRRRAVPAIQAGAPSLYGRHPVVLREVAGGFVSGGAPEPVQARPKGGSFRSK